MIPLNDRVKSEKNLITTAD